MKTKMTHKIVSVLAILSQITAFGGITALASYDYIPEFLYDGESSIKVSGKLNSNKYGGYVTIKMTDSDDCLGYIGQTIIKPDGTYSQVFDFSGNVNDYKLSVNVNGEKIDEDTVSMIPVENRINVDWDIAQNLDVASFTASITDYFGIYTDAMDYVMILAAYDENGKLVGINSGIEAKTNKGSAVNETLALQLPEETTFVKAFLWNSLKDMTPIAKDEGYIPNPNGFDTLNVRQSEWQSVNMRTAQMKNAGIVGGEGGQRIMSIAISKDDTLLLCGNDNGGINRSTDGGQTWEDSSRGLLTKSVPSIAVDPQNKNRVLAFGSCYTSGNVASQLASEPSWSKLNGIYLSEDAGFSWRQVLSQPAALVGWDFRESICYDESTYDERIGGCSTAYWSRPWRLQASQGTYLSDAEVYATETDRKGLWKTTDGGETWTLINADMADGVVKVHPTKGYVYVANMDGFHRSTDGGVTFTTIKSGKACYGLDVVDTKGYEDYVWICTSEGLFTSTNAGQTFSKKSTSVFYSYPTSVDSTNANLLKIVRGLKVDPKNTSKMLIASFDFENGTNKDKKYYTSNGGQYWREASNDNSSDFFKLNPRNPVFVWSNTNQNKAWSTGGDWIVSSANSGATWKWDYNGGGEVFVDQRTIFNIYDPNIMYYGSQDYHGALTTDGGDTWKHIWKLGQSQYAGFVYGSYAVNENVLIAIRATSWSSDRYIYVSRDAGETWTNTECLVKDKGKQNEMCYQSPNNPDILFAGEWRSTDCGATWTEMVGVKSVNAHNPTGRKELYGNYQNKIKVSYDDGATWQDYATVLSNSTPSNTQIWDMAYDHVNDIMYYVSGNGGSGTYFAKIVGGENIDLTANLKYDPKFGRYFQLCAVDPNHPEIVYVGGYGGKIQNPNGVQRSTDGGKTFYTISANTTDSIVKTGPAGGYSPYDLIVHPVTGELWVPQDCNGWAKFPAPY